MHTKKPTRYLVFVLFLTVQLAAVRAQQPLFQLLPAKQTGITFVNSIIEDEGQNVMSYEYFYNGGGVAVGDINNDGFEDLFFTSNMGPNKLYINLGGTKGQALKFKDITNSAGKGLEGRKGGWKTGVTMADVNGDGLLDIYICYSGKVDDEKRKNQLFINQGNLKFLEQAAEYGLDNISYSTQAAFFDYDNDGDLDMMLLNHSVKKIDNMELAKFKQETDMLAGNKLFENQKNKFKEVTQKAGIHQYPLTFGLGMAIADVNQDGWQDIYVTNDYNESDYLYINNQDGTFSDVTQQYFRHLAQFSMGIDIADFNNDGLPDVMSLDMLPEDNQRQKLLQLQENYEAFELMMNQKLHKQYMRNMLQLNNGDGTFSEIAQFSGVSNTDWSWSPLLADFDNDGYKDLFVSNGYLRDYTNKDFLKYWGDYKIRRAVDKEPFQLMDLIRAMPSTKLASYVFRNNKDLTFTKMQEPWGMAEPAISSGAVYTDLDNDGDLDLVVNNINDPAFVYQNMGQEQTGNAWFQIKLRDKGANGNAVGAKVYTYSKGAQQYQEVNPNRGYLSCSPTRLHFGMEKITSIDSVKVIWPDGATEVLKEVKTNQLLVLEKSGKANVKPLAVKKTAPIFQKQNSSIAYQHEGFNENDFKRQPLMLTMYSQTGPIVAKGDVNKDGLEDVFVSGDQNKQARIWLQQKDGTFREMPDFAVGDENISAATSAIFYDANGDGFDDLYVAKGGYSMFEPNTISLQDEMYLNDGKGKLNLSVLSLPNLKSSSKSCVRAFDFDKDGDQDLFVGGRIIPGRYPETPVSYLLINDGKGNYKVKDSPFFKIGMVTDAQWADLDADGNVELVICGEMMPIKVFSFSNNDFTDNTLKFFKREESGFWSSLFISDLDQDGKLDIVAGNMGLNSQIKASEKEPAELYYADFDKNGSIDPFFNFYVQGKSYPFVSRDELNDQIYPMRKKFPYYKDYANASINNMFSAEDLSNATKLEVTEMRSMCFLNKNGMFEKQPLPVHAQFAPVTMIASGDYNQDGKTDLLLLGNKTDNRLKIGSMDANYGCVLAGDGKGGFAYIAQPLSGLSVVGDVKSCIQIDINDEPCLVIGAFNQSLQFYKIAK
ncbi:VCBS repeat-containing protein [Dyadobacter sp. CY107]|uniref:VCBS repeat-containing protein n=1 Tax=Dyadobacter fanqingshengii TaxID=2906443 RepID=UPI001F1A15EA|nr:VCBS repeat-containing protein [Dyadobacter fanqingshengii]MCF2502996.1 VCBS repeat-containing protein [Dyadobacter fanqingshengii]